LVTVVCAVLWPISTIVTWAFGTYAPEASLTEPTIVPLTA